MALIDRLAGFGSGDVIKLSPDAFWGALYELAKGQVTKAEIVAFFALDATEQDELDWIIGKYNAQPTAAAKASFVELMRALLVLAESGFSGYTSNAEIVARINAI